MKLKRVFYWCAVNSIYAGIGYLAVFESIEGAKNIFIFLTYISTLVTIIAKQSEEIRIPLKERGRAVPKMINDIYDISIVFTLLWFSWWVTAIVYFLHVVYEYAIFDSKDNPAKDEG